MRYTGGECNNARVFEALDDCQSLLMADAQCFVPG